jgi:hypothetical protein
VDIQRLRTTKKQHALTVLHRLLTNYTDRGSCGKRYWDTIKGLEEAIEILEETDAI